MDRYQGEMDPYPGEVDPCPAQLVDVDYLDDRIRPIVPASRPTGRALSLPGAVGAAFLVTTLALGAAIVADPGSALPADGGGRAGEAAGAATKAPLLAHASARSGSKHGAGRPAGGGSAKDEPGDEPKDGADEPAKKPADEPAKAPTAEQTRAPATPVTELAFSVTRDGSKVVLDWSACEVDGFYAYKVVRSPDGRIGWPVGRGDVLVAVVEDAAKTALVDADVVSGKTYYYRVIAFAERDGTGVTACKTTTKGVSLEQPKSEPKPTPKPGTATLEIAVAIKEGHVLVKWSACTVAGFDAYKVVRSKDAIVTFPTGDADTLVAAVGSDGTTAAWDEEAPAGRTLWYRVFCVDKADGGYTVVAASTAKSIAVPTAEPKPTPVPSTMGLEVDLTGDGVVLGWEKCGSDGFSFYKVVRSRADNPSYVPWTDGSEVVAVIENAGTTSFVDTSADAGTWYYRVQAIGQWDGQKVLLGQTPVRSVTVE